MENEEIQKSKGDFWDAVSKFLCFSVVAIYLIYILNNIFHFIPVDSFWNDFIVNMNYYGPLAVVVVVSLESIATKHGLFKALLVLCWIFIILFSISPNLFGLIKYN